MITVPWWLPWLAGAGGVGVFTLLATLLVALWMGRIDALVLARVDIRTEQLLTLLAAPPDPGPDPAAPPATDPWSSWQTLHEGLPDTTAPEMPEEHTWWGGRSGLLPIVPLVDPEAAAIVAETVNEDEPKPNPRERFAEPQPPIEITVAAVIPGVEVQPEKVQVSA